MTNPPNHAGYPRSKALCLTLLLSFLGPPAVLADELEKAVELSRTNTRHEAASQQKIDRLDDETRALLEEYQRLGRELDVSLAYHDQIERLVRSQEEDIGDIQRQMHELDATQREVVPLMLRMIDALSELVRADLPFLHEERRQRVARLRALMDRADVSIGEKYRRVLGAYQIELDYGRTIESYAGDLAGGEHRRAVDFLRIGRIGLFYQTLDRTEVGHWNAATQSWERLPDAYRSELRQGLRIARHQAAPALLSLPFAAAVEDPLSGEATP